MDYKIKPWGHQLEAINRSKELENFAFFFEVGAGKTMTCINALRYKYGKYGMLLNTLILAPPIVLENWRREFLAHSKVQDKSIHILTGPRKKRLELFLKYKDKPSIFITNYETLLMGDVFEEFKKWPPHCLVLDESHKCKDVKSKRTKAAIQLGDLANYKFLLSGTPVLNSLMDMFAQFRILDSGETFGRNFYSFRGKYFYNKNAGAPSHIKWQDWRVRKGAEEEMNALVAAKSMHVTKDECLDLPPFVKKPIYVGLGKQQQKIYDSMKQDFIAFVEGKACVADLAITKALRLQQIVSGFIPVKDGEEQSIIKLKENPRAQALKELLADLAPRHKIIVWAVFKENYKTIRDVCEELKLEHVEIHGGVSQPAKLAAVDTFNNDDSCRVLVGHPGSGGIGINLVSSDVSIFYSRNFSLEYDIQAEARNYRGGSERHTKVTRYDLVTPGTIDEQVLKALASKQEIGYKVLTQVTEEI